MYYIIALTTKGHVLTQTDLEEALGNIQRLYTTKTLYVENRMKGSYEKKKHS